MPPQTQSDFQRLMSADTTKRFHNHQVFTPIEERAESPQLGPTGDLQHFRNKRRVAEEASFDYGGSKDGGRNNLGIQRLL